MNPTTQQSAAHTAGPWTHTPMQDTIWANDGETKVATIADLPWVTSPSGRRHSDDATEHANARLIAAAPELLAAARNAANVLAGLAMGHLDTVKPDSPALAQLRSAIARATLNQG